MKGKKPRATKITKAPIRHATLPKELVQRIKAYKKILAEVDDSSLEEAIEDFKRDANPESEVVIWERIAGTYRACLQANKTLTELTVKKEVFFVIVRYSMTTEVFRELKFLGEKEVNALIDIYRLLRVTR